MNGFFLLNAGLVIASILGIICYRVLALRWGIMDIPNARSSHKRPTPRGAGLVTIILVLAGSCWSFSQITTRETAIRAGGILLGGAVIGAVSWWDDLRSLSAGQRLLMHFGAAALALGGYVVDSQQPLSLALAPLPVPIGIVLLLVWIVGLINAYNFMDGIDGLAASQAWIAGLALSVWGEVTGRPELTRYGVIILTSCTGLVIFTWQRATVFMGDSGSAFLGYTFATAPFLAAPIQTSGSTGPWPDVFFIASILSGFLVDTTLAFFQRARRGEKLLQAHRSHFYQRMVDLGGKSHATISLVYAALSLTGAAVAIGTGRLLMPGRILIPAILYLTGGLVLSSVLRLMQRRIG